MIVVCPLTFFSYKNEKCKQQLWRNIHCFQFLQRFILKCQFAEDVHRWKIWTNNKKKKKIIIKTEDEKDCRLTVWRCFLFSFSPFHHYHFLRCVSIRTGLPPPHHEMANLYLLNLSSWAFSGMMIFFALACLFVFLGWANPNKPNRKKKCWKK